uniref:Glycine N-acyltransferase-like protein n=1 Tax=Plectus sambesii TaxID=2011161 RepID=A0A914W236_9BILA
MGKSVPELFWKRELLFECNRAVDTDDIADYISQYGQLEILPRGAAPAPSFFVPQEKWNNLLQLDIRPPEGYYFDTLTEADIPAVSETWRFRRGDDNIQMKFKFGYLPTVCLRCQSDHSLAAFEMLDVSGFMTHLFTFPQHRKKGLAKIVELKLAQKLIANNVTPFKSVVYDNEPGLAISHKSQWFQPMEKRKWHNFYPNSSSA